MYIGQNFKILSLSSSPLLAGIAPVLVHTLLLLTYNQLQPEGEESGCLATTNVPYRVHKCQACK